MIKRAIISKHIVLVDSRLPLYGMILIHNEIIEEVIILDESVPIESIVGTYSEYIVEVFEDYYVSPGIIDMNVRSEWESLSDLTKMGVSGGVTLLVLEDSYYTVPEPIVPPLYTDIAFISRIENIHQKKVFLPGTVALKGYLSAPSLEVPALPSDLNLVFSILLDSNLPIIINPQLPENMRLYMSSPFRHRPLAEREMVCLNNSIKLFSAAFPENLLHTPTEEDDCNSQIEITTSHDQLQKLPNDKRNHKHTSSDTTGIKATPFKTIYDDLDLRVRTNKEDIATLSKAEEDLYKVSGRTTFIDKRVENSKTEEEIESPISPFQRRMQALRPKMVSTSSNVQDDRNYINYLANSPFSWEEAGVQKVLEVLKKYPARVHFSSLCSASAINRIRKFKQKFKHVSCETSSVYLTETAEKIKRSQTKLKDSPPIRNLTNRSLLWELLKMNTIDCISSHHASIIPKYKLESFRKALCGTNSLGFSMQALWTELKRHASDDEQKDHYIVRLAKWMSLNPAKALKINHLTGSIEKGKLANLIVWSPSHSIVASSYSAFSSMNIYEEMKLDGRIQRVYIRGNCIYGEGDFIAAGKIFQY